MFNGLAEATDTELSEAPAASFGARLRAIAARVRLPALIVVPILIFLLSLALGRYSVSIGELFTLFGAKLGLTEATVSQQVSTVILNVRLPRIIAAMLIGTGLALSGAA